MTVSLSPIGNGTQFFTTGGLPLNAGFLKTYQAGTTTPQLTYTTSAGNVANPLSIQLGVDGRPPNEIWLTNGIAYKFVLTDSGGSPIAGGTYDNITGLDNATKTLIATLASSSGSASIGFIQTGTGAVPRTLESKVREIVSVPDFVDETLIPTISNWGPIIQLAIDSGVGQAHVGTGSFPCTTPFHITNKNGFVLSGDNMTQSHIYWNGAPGATMCTMRGSWFSSIRDMWLDCNGIASTSLSLPCYNAGAGDTYVPTMNSFEHLRLGNTQAGATIAVIVGDGVGTQLDNQTFYKCWIDNAGKLVTIQGIVTLHINFTECVFSGYSAIPTTVGVDIISGGLVNFNTCQYVGNGPTVAYIQRSITALGVTITGGEMESDGKFLYCPDDTGFANTWPITITGTTIGFTGAGGTNFIDYRQRGALIINGGDINSLNAANLNHAPPGTGVLRDVGVRYVNTTIVQNANSVRCGVKASGETLSGAATGNIAGQGAATAGVVQTFGGASVDATLSRMVSHRAGGNGAKTQQCSQTTTAITTATVIAGTEDVSFVMVRGSDGAGNEFFDLLISTPSGTVSVVTSATTAGAPAVRTYSMASFDLKLAMASGTYTTNCHWFQLSAR